MKKLQCDFCEIDFQVTTQQVSYFKGKDPPLLYVENERIDMCQRCNAEYLLLRREFNMYVDTNVLNIMRRKHEKNTNSK